MAASGFERVLNLFWVALGLAAMAGSVSIGVWSAGRPGSGFLPFIGGAIVGGCGLFLLLTGNPEHQAISLQRPALDVATRMAVILLGLIAIAVTMPYIGFVCAAIPVMVALMLAVERQSWISLLLVSVISTLSIHFLFSRLLGTKLPASGILWF